MNRRMLIGVDVMFLAICVAAAIVSLDFAKGARPFPLFASLIATPLAAANLWQDLRARSGPDDNGQHDDAQDDDAQHDDSEQRDAADSAELRKAAKWLGYIVAFALAVLLVGIVVAATLWLVYFLRRYGNVRYGYILVNLACVLAALYLLNRFLGITLPTGIFW